MEYLPAENLNDVSNIEDIEKVTTDLEMGQKTDECQPNFNCSKAISRGKKRKSKINEVAERRQVESQEAEHQTETFDLAVDTFKESKEGLDELSAFSVIVASKLRKMNNNQRLLAELLVNKVLYCGLTGKLTELSDITYPDPPSTSPSNFEFVNYYKQEHSE